VKALTIHSFAAISEPETPALHICQAIAVPELAASLDGGCNLNKNNDIQEKWLGDPGLEYVK